MGRPAKYSDDFKRDAVKTVEAGQPIEHVAADLGVAHSSLSRWKKKFGPSVQAPPPASDEGLRKENARLFRRAGELEEEREILREATASSAGRRNGSDDSISWRQEAKRLSWPSIQAQGDRVQVLLTVV